MPRTRPVLAAGALTLALVAVAGCSNNRESSVNRRPATGATTAAVTDGVQQVTVVVDDEYRFDPSTITVHPGQVRITLQHKGKGAPHNLQVVGFPTDRVPLVSHGQSVSATFTAPSPGSYRFVCTLHEAQGQTGTLVVLAN